MFSGDGVYGTDKLARFARRHRERLRIASKFYPDAVLHAPPPPRRKGQKGRKKVRGNRLPSSELVVNSSARWRKLTVAWHGGGRRDIKVIRRVSRWYRQGHRLVTIRWVDVRDLTGTLRDECLMATDDGLSEAQIVENDVGRWDIEVMYEEMREHLGLEKNRGRSMQTVVRVEPCLFCPYSLIVLRFASLPGDPLQRLLIRWPGKTSITFSDAIATVRRQTWTIYINETTILGSAVEKLTRSQRQSLLDAPALAA